MMSTSEHQKRENVEAVKALLRMPHWSQLRDTMGFYGTDQNASLDCGEECCSLLVFSTRGIEVPAGYIRWLIGVPEGLGTTGNDLAGYLRREGYHNARVRWPASDAGWLAIGLHVREGRLCIMLGHWLSPDVGHWMVPLAQSRDTLLVSDPWSGAHRTVTRHFFTERFEGQIVEVQARASYPKPGSAWFGG